MLTVEAVSTAYGAVQALRDVSIEVAQGEIVTANQAARIFSVFTTASMVTSSGIFFPPPFARVLTCHPLQTSFRQSSRFSVRRPAG